MASISARLERLPITSVHRKAIVALAFAYFFELGDLSTLAYAAPSIIQQWHISVEVIALATSAGFAGMFVGATIGGWFGDRVGRKRGLVASLAIYTLFSFANAFAWNVPSLVVLRFLTGIGLSSLTVIANTYITEVFPARQRGRYLGLILTLGLVGIPATAWVARFLVPLAPWAWRLVFVWGALGIFALLLVLGMAESPRWYRLRGADREAEDAVQAFERAALAEHGSLPPADELHVDEIQHSHTAYRELFAPPQLGRTVLLVAVWIFQTVGAYGFIAWVPTLLNQHGFSIVRSLTFTSVIAICNPLGALLASLVVDRVERKWFITVVTLGIAVSGLLFGLATVPAFIMLFGALVVLGIQAFIAAIYIYTPELFPTRMRSSGHGLVYGVGRLANVVGPFIVAGLLRSFGYLSVFVYIAVCWLLASAVVGLFGPRTSRRDLETLNLGAGAAAPALPLGSDWMRR